MVPLADRFFPVSYTGDAVLVVFFTETNNKTQFYVTVNQFVRTATLYGQGQTAKLVNSIFKVFF